VMYELAVLVTVLRRFPKRTVMKPVESSTGKFYCYNFIFALEVRTVVIRMSCNVAPYSMTEV
jgi:hypothetical protein